MRKAKRMQHGSWKYLPLQENITLFLFYIIFCLTSICGVFVGEQTVAGFPET